MLFCRAQSAEQRQHLGGRGTGAERSLHRIPSVADLRLTWQEHQHVPRRLTVELAQRLDDRLHLVVGLVRPLVDIRILARPLVVGIRGVVLPREGAVPDLDGIGAPGDLDDRGGLARRVGEVRREGLRIDGGRGDDDLQIGSLGQDAPEVPQQEVDVQ